MFRRFDLAFFLVILVAIGGTVAFAGKIELTTYYPAPMGEYAQLSAKGKDTSNGTVAFQAGGSAGNGLVVTNANQVGIGTLAPEATLDVAGEVRVGNSSIACTASNTGAMRYDIISSRMQFCNGEATTPAWENIGRPVTGGGVCLNGLLNFWGFAENVWGGATCSNYFGNLVTPAIASVVCPAGSVKRQIFDLHASGYGGEAAICE